MYALVDCNNFYCSCERVFNPKLEGRPVIVLSNNDGCAVARSEEAKALGIQMAAPEFMIRDIIKQHNVAVFSSNYTLYGDFSDRIMKTIASFVPRIEVYSIDEAFLDMHDLAYQDLLQLGVAIRKTIKKNIGLPVTVGIASTKTLAKMANWFAKKNFKDVGVFWAANKTLENEMLSFTEVGDIWGIGPQYEKLLRRNGFKTASDLANVPDEWIRKNMTVVGQRLLNELRGIPCMEWEFDAPVKKNICTSRSFGNLMTEKKDIQEAVATYTASCALKLRQQKSCATKVHVFLQTNPHRIQEEQYFRSITIPLPVASNSTTDLLKFALKGLDIIFRKGLKYLKCGVMVLELIPEEQIQFSLFDNNDRRKTRTATHALDKINKVFGKDIVRFATQGYEKRYRLRSGKLSPRYTTNINEIPIIKI